MKMINERSFGWIFLSVIFIAMSACTGFILLGLKAMEVIEIAGWLIGLFFWFPYAAVIVATSAYLIVSALKERGSHKP